MNAPRFEIGEIYDTTMFSAVAISETQLLVFEAHRKSWSCEGECYSIAEWDLSLAVWPLSGTLYQVKNDRNGRAILVPLFIGG